jgi:hypothetical protein
MAPLRRAKSSKLAKFVNMFEGKGWVIFHVLFGNLFPIMYSQKYSVRRPGNTGLDVFLHTSIINTPEKKIDFKRK